MYIFTSYMVLCLCIMPVDMVLCGMVLYSYSKRHGNTGQLASLWKGGERMDKSFFDLPRPVKKAIWAALLAEWEEKKPATVQQDKQQA